MYHCYFPLFRGVTFHCSEPPVFNYPLPMHHSPPLFIRSPLLVHFHSLHPPANLHLLSTILYAYLITLTLPDLPPLLPSSTNSLHLLSSQTSPCSPPLYLPIAPHPPPLFSLTLSPSPLFTHLSSPSTYHVILTLFVHLSSPTSSTSPHPPPLSSSLLTLHPSVHPPLHTYSSFVPPLLALFPFLPCSVSLSTSPHPAHLSTPTSSHPTPLFSPNLPSPFSPSLPASPIIHILLSLSPTHSSPNFHPLLHFSPSSPLCTHFFAPCFPLFTRISSPLFKYLPFFTHLFPNYHSPPLSSSSYPPLP